MDGFDDKIAALLSSPDAMDKVMNMAKALGASGGDNETERHAPGDDTEREASGLGSLASLASGGALGDLLGGMDPAMLGKMIGLMGEYNKTDDRRENLLKAVRPYLKPERQEKIGRAVQIVKLARTARSAIGNG